MPAISSAGVVPKAAIAAIIGTLVGGTAGLWSLRRPAANVNAVASVPTATPVAAPSNPAAAAGAAATASSSQPNPATSPQPPARASAATPAAPDAAAAVRPAAAPAAPAASATTTDDEARVLQRARALARRPDVTALIALRDDVVRRATERGIADSSSVKSELDELDQRLNEARTLQLKLDADEFRKADSKRPR
ncbi:MAG TPA: hypothetical protein VKE96_07605 [Vicinamibacterales bacterium]|nr:hypothetical protein [Vicinamibacterales bacterium]